jgi:hypothetical protein
VEFLFGMGGCKTEEYFARIYSYAGQVLSQAIRRVESDWHSLLL